MDVYYDRVKKAVDIYEGSVNDNLNGRKINAVLDIFYITLTLVLVIIAVLFSNLAGLITTLGFGGLTASSQGQVWIATIKSYVNDRLTLRRGVDRLKQRLALCEKGDKESLDQVKNLIEELYDAMDEAVKG